MAGVCVGGCSGGSECYADAVGGLLAGVCVVYCSMDMAVTARPGEECKARTARAVVCVEQQTVLCTVSYWAPVSA